MNKIGIKKKFLINYGRFRKGDTQKYWRFKEIPDTPANRLKAENHIRSLNNFLWRIKKSNDYRFLLYITEKGFATDREKPLVYNVYDEVGRFVKGTNSLKEAQALVKDNDWTFSNNYANP